MPLLRSLFARSTVADLGASIRVNSRTKNRNAAGKTSATAQTPEERRLIVAEANALAVAGHYGRSLALVYQALSTVPDDPELLLAKAFTLFESGRFHEASNGLRRVLEVAPEQYGAYLQLGWSLLEVGNYREAEVWMRKAVEAERDSWKTHFGLATSLYRIKQHDEAVTSLEQCISLGGSELHAQVLLGKCKLDQGDLIAAEAHLRRALELDGDGAIAWTNLGLALNRQGRFSEGLEALTRAEQLETCSDLEVGSFDNLASGLRTSDALMTR